jgi:hypothetical protein
MPSAAKLRDVLLAAQSFQHNTDLPPSTAGGSDAECPSTLVLPALYPTRTPPLTRRTGNDVVREQRHRLHLRSVRWEVSPTHAWQHTFRPPRRVLAGVNQNHPNRTGPDLGRKLFVVLLVMAPSSQELEPPAIRGRFRRLNKPDGTQRVPSTLLKLDPCTRTRCVARRNGHGHHHPHHHHFGRAAHWWRRLLRPRPLVLIGERSYISPEV